MGGVFSLDVMLVPLGSCEIVLGVQWLASVGPILWDFEKLRMEFKYKGQRVVLRGTQKLDVEWLEGKRSQQKLHKSAQIFALQIYPVSSATLLSSINNCSPALQQLLDEYKDIFEEPKVLPPLGMGVGRVRGGWSRTRTHTHFLKSSPYPYPYPSGLKNSYPTHTHRVFRVLRVLFGYKIY